MQPEETRAEYLRQESTSALVCLPFLDTDMPEERAFANRILAERGYPKPLVTLLRSLAAIGLWYQVVLWEEWHLDLWDVLAGYGLLAAPLGMVLLFLSVPWGLGCLSLSAVLLLLAWRGWLHHRRNSQQKRDAA